MTTLPIYIYGYQNNNKLNTVQDFVSIKQLAEIRQNSSFRVELRRKRSMGMVQMVFGWSKFFFFSKNEKFEKDRTQKSKKLRVNTFFRIFNGFGDIQFFLKKSREIKSVRFSSAYGRQIQ